MIKLANKYKSIFLTVITNFLGFGLLCYVSSANAVTLGEVSTNLMGPTEILTKIMILGCYVVGIALLIMAIAQYKQHKHSPKLVPLTTPIILIILGLIAIGLPTFTNVFGPSFSATEQAKEEGRDIGGSNLPLPPTPKPKVPGPGKPLPEPMPTEPYSDPYDAPYKPAPDYDRQNSNGGGHWTDEYN